MRYARQTSHVRTWIQIRLLFVPTELCFMMKGSHLQIPQFKTKLKVTLLRTHESMSRYIVCNCVV